MHAFLIVGENKEERDAKAEELSKKISNQIFEFPAEKIEDIRNLKKILKFSQSQKISVILKEIQNSTKEAMNAFLKILEEPPENINFILTSSSEKQTLPTIASRCEVIRVLSKAKESVNIAKNFLKTSEKEKVSLISGLKEREKAKEFLISLFNSLHSMLHSEKKNHKFLSEAIEITQETINTLNANGNLTLQMTNFLIRIGKLKNPYSS